MKCWIYLIYDGFIIGGEIKYKLSCFFYFGGYKIYYYLMVLLLVMYFVQLVFVYFIYRSNMFVYRSLKECIKYVYFWLSFGSIKYIVQKLRVFDYYYEKID